MRLSPLPLCCAACFLGIFSLGCAPVSSPSIVMEPAETLTPLKIAADQIQTDLQRLSQSLSQAPAHLSSISVPDGSPLNRLTTFQWVGQSVPALTCLADMAGFKVEVRGKKQDKVVTVDAVNTKLIEIVEDIAWQMSPNGVVVNEDKRLITVYLQ